MYTLGAFLGLIAFWGAWNVLAVAHDNSNTRNRYGVLYVIAGALGIYTLYYFAFLLIAFNIWAAIELVKRGRGDRRIRTDLLRWVALQIGILILYGPWLGIALRQILDPPVPPWRSPVSMWSAIVQAWGALSFGQSVEPRQVSYVLLLPAALFLIGLIFTLRRSISQGLALVLYTVCPIVLIMLVSVWVPLFHTRYVFTYSPAFYLVLAAGLAWMLRRMRWAGILIALVWFAITGYSIYAFHYDARYSSDDFRAAVHYIAQNVRPGDAVLIDAGYVYPIFTYYYPYVVGWRGRLVDYDPASVTTQGTVVLQTGTIGGSSNLGWGLPDSDFYSTDETQTAQSLEKVFAAHPRLWVLRAYDTVVDPDGFIRSWLENHGRMFEDKIFPGESYIRVQGFLTQKQPIFAAPPLSEVSDLTFGDGLRLLGYSSQSDNAESGKDFDIDLYWQAENRLSSNYRAIIELTDKNGSPWVRSDELLLGTAYPTSQWIPGEVLRQPCNTPRSRGNTCGGI